MRAGLTCDCDIDGAQIGRGQWESGHRETSQHSAQPRQCRSASLLWEATGLQYQVSSIGSIIVTQQVPAVSSVQYLSAAMRRGLVSWSLKAASSCRVLGAVQARPLSTGDQVSR